MKWAGKFKRRGLEAVVSQYDFDEAAFHVLKSLHFAAYSEKWLDFIMACRTGKDLSDYDVVSGGVANDKVFNTIELYFDHLINEREALQRLRYEKPNMQVCLRTEAALRYLHFERSETL